MRRGRPPIRGIRGANIRGRGIGRGAPALRTSSLSINLSDSSSYDSYSADLPVIKTKPVNNQNSNYNIQRESSDEEYSSTITSENPKKTAGAMLYSDDDYSDDFGAENPVLIENHHSTHVGEKAPTEFESSRVHNERKSRKPQNWGPQGQQPAARDINSQPNNPPQQINIEPDVLDPNDIAQNDLQQNCYQQNGYQQNGYQQNGYQQNGYQQNGYHQNGYQQNGYSQNGHQQNGYQQNDFQENQISQNGMQPNIQVQNGDLNSNQSPNQDQTVNSVNAGQQIPVSGEQPNPEASPSPMSIIDNPNDVTTYRISWKSSGMGKSHIQMMINNEIILQSKEGKTDIGKVHIICTDGNIDRFSKSYQGSLKKSQSLRRFTLFAPQGEQYQNQEGELMGFSFYNPKEIRSFGVRAFRIAFPKNQPYFPSTKEMNLSKIAQNNMQSDDFKIYQSKLPELLPGPILKLQFGNVHVVSSVKNFIMEDENNNVIFMIYKSSNGMCSIRIAPPITPLYAFCIAIAVITSRK